MSVSYFHFSGDRQTKYIPSFKIRYMANKIFIDWTIRIHYIFALTPTESDMIELWKEDQKDFGLLLKTDAFNISKKVKYLP